MPDELNLREMLAKTPRRDVAAAGFVSVMLAVLGLVALNSDSSLTLLVWSSIPLLLWGALFRLMLWHPGWAAAWLSAVLTGIVVAFAWKVRFAGLGLEVTVLVTGGAIVAYLGYRTFRWFARMRTLAAIRPTLVDSGLIE